MKIALITAMADNRVIGVDNSLPWSLPADMAWFRQHTLNKPVVMGRKTFESLPIRPLPKRTNLVISRDPNYQAKDLTGRTIDSVLVATSIDEAAQKLDEHDEVMCIGGANLYEQMLPHADLLYLTRIHEEFEGDAFFPEIAQDEWQEVFCESHEPDERNPHPYSFTILERRR